MVDDPRFGRGVAHIGEEIDFKARAVADDQPLFRLGQAHAGVVDVGDRRVGLGVDHHAAGVDPLGDQLGERFGNAQATGRFDPCFTDDQSDQIKDRDHREDDCTHDGKPDKEDQHQDKRRGNGPGQ